MKLYSINAGYFKNDGGVMFGIVPKSIWKQTNPPDEHNLCSWALRCLLIEDEDRLILIDTGIGNKQDPKFLSRFHLHGEDSLDKSLAHHGFCRDDITDVFLTHLHFDHCGGCIERADNTLVPSFRNAVYWIHERQWNWALRPNEREKSSFLEDNILPILQSGKLKFIASPDNAGDQESKFAGSGFQPTLLPFSKNINIFCVNGHTESMMLPVIDYKDTKIIYVGDLLPSAGHIPIPYVAAYDLFPLSTIAEKKWLLNLAMEKGYILFFEHDAVNECCKLQLTDRGIRASEFFRLSAI